jgi:hypothetical protein
MFRIVEAWNSASSSVSIYLTFDAIICIQKLPKILMHNISGALSASIM